MGMKESTFRPHLKAFYAYRALSLPVVLYNHHSLRESRAREYSSYSLLM